MSRVLSTNGVNSSLFLSSLLSPLLAAYVVAPCSSTCLFLSSATDIITLDYKSSAMDSVTVIYGLTRAVAVKVYFSLGYIFWSEVSEQNIKHSLIGGSGLTTIITGTDVCDG